jgi:hypothetical protein
MTVITNVRNAVFLAKQRNQPIQVDIAGIQLTVKPNSNPSEIVNIWETEFEKRKK